LVARRPVEYDDSYGLSVFGSVSGLPLRDEVNRQDERTEDCPT
jgi:hypothetical protein